MQITQPVWAIGLMSGTSLDGVDAALIRSDGKIIHEFGATIGLSYSPQFRSELHALLQGRGNQQVIERTLTLLHIEAVQKLLQQAQMQPQQIAVIGMHGQTIWHRPQIAQTCQIGDAQLLANECKIAVVHDFRSNDMRHGGQGAPLVPLFHAALAGDLPKPLAMVNIGGVANITFIGDEIIALDCGTGNALIDDLVQQHTGKTFDLDGAIAASGTADMARVQAALQHDFFARPAPKSLDRLDFSLNMVNGLNLADGAATLLEFTVQAIALGLKQMPQIPTQLLATGGGRHNKQLMRRLAVILPNIRVAQVEDVGLNGDMLEAQAFAFLALRSLRGLPLSLPSTTGVKIPVTGGKLVLVDSL